MAPPIVKLGDAHTMLADMMRRVADLERRANNTLRQAKVNDIDEKNWRVRVLYSPNDQKSQVLSGWVPWTERAGNIREWRPPTVGEAVHIFSPSGEVGMHSWIMRGGFTTKEGELIDSKPFVAAQDTRDQTRETIEVIETRNTTGKYGTGGAQPPQSQGQPGPTDKIFSRIRSADMHELVTVTKQDDKQQTQPHDEVWKKRTVGAASFQDGTGRKKVTSEDVQKRLLTVKDQIPAKHQVLVQDGSKGVSTDKTQNADLHRIISQDGLQYTGKTGLGGFLGLLDQLWKGAGASGGGGNRKTTRTMNPAQHMIESLEGSSSTLRNLIPGLYKRITSRAGFSTSTTTQTGGTHHIKSDTLIGRKTKDYKNNALRNHKESASQSLMSTAGQQLLHKAGQMMKLSSGGVMKIHAPKGSINLKGKASGGGLGGHEARTSQVEKTIANTVAAKKYETGTWDPQLKFGNNNANMTLHTGSYVRIGELIIAQGQVTFTGGAGGNATIAGLPYASSNALSQTGSLHIRIAVSPPIEYPHCRLASGASVLSLWTGDLTLTGMTLPTAIAVEITYRAIDHDLRANDITTEEADIDEPEIGGTDYEAEWADPPDEFE